MDNKKRKYVTNIPYVTFHRDIMMLERVGWIAHYTRNDGNLPLNAHTHGLNENFSHEDLQIVIPLSMGMVQTLFNIAFCMIQNGERIKTGALYSNFFEGYQVEFKRAVECERTVLRMILPDRKGLFPNDPLCDPEFKFQVMDTLI